MDSLTNDKIIDGKKVSSEVKENLKKEILKATQTQGKKPGLAVILLGEDPASKIYVSSKHKTCQELEIESRLYTLPKETTQPDLLTLIDDLNNDPDINGILVQLPLPKHISDDIVIKKINPLKDVDCFHPENLGLLFAGKPRFLPCTPQGIIKLIDSTGIDLTGKNAVILGRSNIVGKPIFFLLLEKNATVTICHSKTVNLKAITKQADIIVASIGVPKFLTADMVKDNVIIIDVGINRIDGKIVGDVDFENIVEKASYITPVPGGVGPMTIAMLMQNTLKAFKIQSGILK